MAQTRLAIATPRFWPLVGDISTHLMRLAESLVASGNSVTIVMPQWSTEWPRQMTMGPVSVARLRGAPRGGWSTLRWMYSLSSWLREQGPSAVLVAGLRHEAYVAIGVAQRTKMRVVALAGEGDLAWQQTAPFGRRIGARCLEAPAIVAPSQTLADELARSGYSAESITVIERCVPILPARGPRQRDEARAALAAANYDLATAVAAPVALAVGRLDPEHRFGDLVRAWRIVTARRSEARLWIIGDGPERDRLYRQISDLDQRFRVLIPGTFDGLEVLLQAADMLLVPAAHAVPPLAMLEALAAGLPVIAAEAPAVSGYITPELTGLLHAPGDVKALAAAILKLMENPSTAVSLGSAAREQMRARPTPAEEAAQYLALLSPP